MQKISQDDKNAVDLALDFLRSGKIISFATDTVYGFAVDASNEKAVASLYALKNRQENKPIAIFLPSFKVAKEIFIFDDLADKIVEKFSSHPLTLVMKKHDSADLKLAKNINSNDEFLGFRVVNKKFIDKLLYKFGGVLAVTSANISGKSAAIEACQVEESFADKKDLLVIDGGICQQKIASTVIKIFQNNMEILRKGLFAQKIKTFIKNENSN